MYKVSDRQYLVSEQYRDSEKLRARIALFERFSTNKEDFAHSMLSHITAPAKAKVLELGCGPANLWVKNRERIPATWHITLTDLSPGMVEEARLRMASPSSHPTPTSESLTLAATNAKNPYQNSKKVEVG